MIKIRTELDRLKEIFENQKKYNYWKGCDTLHYMVNHSVCNRCPYRFEDRNGRSCCIISECYELLR